MTSKLSVLTNWSIRCVNCPGPFVANNHCVQFLRSFDEKGCLRGAVRRGVSITVGFDT